LTWGCFALEVIDSLLGHCRS